jgi:cardiolipin synthase
VKTPPWSTGNRLRLLENGEAYYPRVCEVIAAARSEVLVETFILAPDEVGRELRAALIAAARRGCRVEMTVDGYGSNDLPAEFVAPMLAAGCRVRVFDPAPTLLGWRTNAFRRLHRKLIAVDGRRAFVGGLNFSVAHLRKSGAGSKQDYALEVSGPVAGDIRRLMLDALPDSHDRHTRQPGSAPRLPAESPTTVPPDGTDDAQAILVTRDNHHHRDDIEYQYRLGARLAQRELIIANAYFFPSYRLLRSIVGAAQRGVRVRLILQGEPDMPLVRKATLVLYDYLLRRGVSIYEYCERPFHGKVALMDDEWATVGSSNLDPLSLALNLEANLVVRDRALNGALRDSLERLMQRHCKRLNLIGDAPPQNSRRQLAGLLAFHFARHFPGWAGLAPGHRHQALTPIGQLPEAAWKRRHG